MRVLKWLAVGWIIPMIFGPTGGIRGDGSAEPIRKNVDVSGLVDVAPVLVSQLTGPESPAQTQEPWNIYGTDLGISIELDDTIYMVFGDTWGREDSEGSDWRSNTMAIVEPHPEYGYIITDVIKDEKGEAKELLASLKEPETEYTVMPTAGIAIDDRMYLHYMSINDWKAEDWDYKHPKVNGSGLAYSDDKGQTWTKDETAWWPGNTNFTQTAMVEHDGYVYMFGTPAGRFGSARLLRVDEEDLLDPQEYEYWDGEDWSDDPERASVVVPRPVGEMSVRWSPYHQRWLMMYLNDVTHNIVLRTAEELTGPWDEERVIVTAAEFPTLYAPYMLPIEGRDIYFTMSVFKAYQVFVMRLSF